MSKISIIIPVYNVKEEYLRVCLESVLSQTFQDTQIVIIDDGSTNSSNEICNLYAQKDKRICLEHTDNRGVSCARNLGIEKATGEYIIFVDADDWIEKGLCEKLDAVMQKYPCDILIHAYKLYHGLTANKHCLNIPDGYFAQDNKRYLQLKILRYVKKDGNINPCTVWGKMYRSSFIKNHKLRFVEGMKRGEDMIFNLYAIEYAEKIATIDYLGYNYRLNQGPERQYYNYDIVNQAKTTFNQVSKFIDQFNKGEIFRQGYYTYVIASLYEQMYFYYFSKQNPNSVRSQVKEFLRNMKQEPYKSGYKYVDRRNTIIKVRIYVFISKLHMNWLWGYAYWIRNRIK